MVEEINPLAALKTFKQQFETDGDCASALSVSKAYLSQMLNEQRPISPRILRRLGLRRAVISSKNGAK